MAGAAATVVALTLTAGQAGAASSIERQIPQNGRYSFLLKLDPASTVQVYENVRSNGTGGAGAAARAQRGRITSAQDEVAESLPSRTPVLFRTHSVIAGLAVNSRVENLETLKGLPGVKAVYPIAPKVATNASAVPLQGAPAAWTATSNRGEGVSIAVIDSGIDYTHADFGGEGTVEAYDAAHTGEGSEADPSAFPSAKVVGGYDFVGDEYDANAETGDPAGTPKPDTNPLDCSGHGTHVAGTAAGFGENPDGSTYAGTYDDSMDFDAMKIGPGMAPAATLYAYRVLGCEGSTEYVTDAIDRATDPDNNGSPSDHVDVINMSLGSDFGGTQDADSVASNAAVDLGVSVVVSAGNAGDVTDVSGAPGNASKVITVANSQDAISRIDGAAISINGGADQSFGVERAELYEWKASPNLTGTVIKAPANNETACTAYPANTFNGEVVLVKWTDDNLECGSIARGKNLRDAGAGGFIFASNKETFSAGINGDTEIPGVLMVKSGGDAIRTALDNSQSVEVHGSVVNSIVQDYPDDIDKIAPSSSRGIHAAGNVKPDVTAVGTSVLSAQVGGGDDGRSLTGTSMAAPMVAGLSALVRSENPGWTPLQTKADIMNTAGQDLHVNGSANPAGDTYSPVRVGAGRIQAEPALDNQVLAYNPENESVSVSFGPVEVTGPITLTKDVTVQNTGDSDATYDTSYEAITSVPGVSYEASPSQVTVAPGGTETVTVTFEVTDVSALTKTVDPTVGRDSGIAGIPRQTLAEAAGRLLLEPTSGTEPTLRVPVYSAPRPTSQMTQAASLDITGAPDQTADLELTGSDLGYGGTNGSGNADPLDNISSIAQGFELQARSGTAPACGGNVTVGCYRLPEDRSADLKYVGFTSDFPDFGADGRGYFAVTTQQPWTIPATKQLIQIDIDVDGDNVPDLFLQNLGDSVGDQAEDVFISALFDQDGETVDVQALNGLEGNVDSAIYDSDSMILPFSLDALEAFGVDVDNPRISYGIETYSGGSSRPVDLLGIDPQTGELSDPLSVNLFEPAIRVTDANGDGPLVADESGQSLKVHRNVYSYAGDNGEGLLMLHLHNAVGDKAQVVTLPEVQLAGPDITGRVSSPSSPNPRGWYRTPVTVSFTCTAGTSAIVGDCPGPVLRSANGKGQSVTRSITAEDGTADSATVSKINIDRTKPTVKIRGVRKGRTYRKAPRGRCVARDPLSKVRSCRLTKKRRGDRITYTARAVDRAGNIRLKHLKVRISRK